MKTTKLLYIISAFLLMAAFTPCQARKGEKTLGLTGGYTWANHSPVAGIDFTYSFSSHVRIAPGVQAVFRNNNRDALLINLDMQFPWHLAASRVNVFPLVGVHYGRWSMHKGADSPAEDDSSDRSGGFGANIGGGLGWSPTRTFKVTAKAVYLREKHRQGTTISLGVAYVF